jgi:hypothetical protein
MLSTYDQFVNRFKTQLREVAEFDGEESTTMEVIIDSLVQAGLKEICDGFDGRKAGTAKSPVVELAEKKSKKTSTSTKKTTETQKAGDDEKPAKGKRVTAYNIYVAEQVKEKKTTMKEAAASWKTMSDEDKAPYVAKAKATNGTE